MKRKLVVILVVMMLIISAGVIGIYKYIESNLGSVADADITEINMAEIKDGVYNGSYSAFPVSAEVRVTVKDHSIMDIRILKHINGQGAPAEIIIDRVMETQTLQVDSVSGATYSSKVILHAIENALISKNN